LTFKEFSLHDSILQAIEAMGFNEPTPVQEEVIPLVLEEERDIVALAQTGTGKTAAFGLPILEQLRQQPKEVGALVLCPTRELAIQISKELQAYAAGLPHIAIDVVYGGAGYGDQVRSLKKGVHILVATPGRLLDLITRGKADISSIRYLVLDEADIMLNMGFKEELDAILEAAPVERRTILMSATMPNEVARIAETYMNDPLEITIGRRNAAAQSVEHTYYLVRGGEKYAALKRLVDFNPDMYAIIFCRTRISTQEIADRLISDGYDAEALHGDLSQSQREFVMNKFRRKNLQFLVATDIAARGLDVQDLSHVIHYDLPDEVEMYTHRSGRTGRAGNTGCSYAIVGAREKKRLQHIERVIKTSIRPSDVPGGDDIFQKQLIDFAERLAKSTADPEEIEAFMPAVREKLEGLDREELLQKLIGMQFSQMIEYYRDLPDMKPVREKQAGSSAGNRVDRRTRNRSGYEGRGGDFGRNRSENSRRRDGKHEGAGSPHRGGDREQGGRSRRSGIEEGFVGIRLSLGKRDGVAPPDLIGIVNQSTRIRGIEIGRIKINESWSNLQVDEEFAEEVYRSLDGFTYKGRDLKADLMKSKGAQERTEGRSSKSSRGSGKKSVRNGASKTSKKGAPKVHMGKRSW